MRKLKSLAESFDTVWFYCRTERLAEEFLKQCEEEGFLTLNGQKPTLLFRHKFYGVFDDMTMGYLSNMIWCLTFQNEIDEHVRIDYEKYISDAEEYYCHKTKGKKEDYSNWNTIAYSNGLTSKDFAKLCDHFIEGQTFEEYNAYIYRYLVESSWQYASKQAVERIVWEEYYISRCFIEKRPVSECAIEVGYGCG